VQLPDTSAPSPILVPYYTAPAPARLFHAIEVGNGRPISPAGSSAAVTGEDLNVTAGVVMY
jgi:hypothetical protein